MTVPVIILIVIVVVIALFLVSLYNGLVTKRNQIDEALGQIEVQLKRRHDLIPNLINAVKGYMGFEQKVLTEVTKARANAVAAGAKGPAEQANAENALTASLRSLFAVVENYPELKANENVLAAAGGADDDGEPDQLLAPALQRDGPRLQQRDPDVPGRAHRGPVRLPQARVLRRRARGGRGPDRRPEPQLTPAGRATEPVRRPHRLRVAPWPARFYQQIGANKRNSVLLAVIVTVLLGALGLFIGWAVTGDPRAALPSLVRSRSASGWSRRCSRTTPATRSCSRVSGAKEIDPQAAAAAATTSSQEMAIAANVPMPKVYLIDDTAPNAFATGRDPQHASVAITTGLLQKLDREELQGVMAHELSHVRNFDIRFSLMVGVLVGSIALLADFFLRFTFWGGGRRSPEQQRQRRWRAADRRVRGRDRARDPRADRGPARPAGDQPPARVPGRRVGRRADAQPGRSRAGAGEDRARPRSRSRSPTGRPSTSTSRTRSRACRASSRTCSRPTRR